MRVHTIKKARNSKYKRVCRRCGREIKTGEKYFWFQFRNQSKTIFCCDHYPKCSEMTNSDKLQRLYSAQEEIEDQSSFDDLLSTLQSASETAEEVGSEYQESADNLDGRLNYDELEEKASSCEAWASDLQELASEMEDIEGENKDSQFGEFKERATDISESLEL